MESKTISNRRFEKKSNKKYLNKLTMTILIVSNDTIKMKSPYEITPEILKLIVSVSEKIGEVNAKYLVKQNPTLRKQNKIKTIHSSLSIEGNTLSSELSSATATRDLKEGIENQIIEKSGDKKTTIYIRK